MKKGNTIFPLLAGVWFGAILDTHHWTLGAEQTVASWLTVAAASL